MGTTFYFYAVTIFTPDDNVLAFFTEEVVYSMLIFEWVTVAQSQTKIFFCKRPPPTQTQADYLLLLLKAVHTNFIILGFIRSIYRTQDEPANHYDTDLLNNIINLTLLSDI